MTKRAKFNSAKWEDNGAADKACKDLFSGKTNKGKTKLKVKLKPTKKQKKKDVEKKANLFLKNNDHKVINNKVYKTSSKKTQNTVSQKKGKGNKKIKHEKNSKKVDEPKETTKNFKSEKKKPKKVQSQSNLPENNKKTTKNKQIKLKLKEQLKKVLVDQRVKDNVPKPKEKKVLSLREKMTNKLKSARFRFLNEQMYTVTGTEANELFKKDPKAFVAYHEGYKQQVKVWPINPLNVIIKSIKKMPKNLEIADFGCGEAMLAESVKQKVYSFDLVATNDRVTACDMSKVPLGKDSVDVAVFCLSLMGTNLNDYILEANRVLKTGGVLKIAEVESRFNNVEDFIKNMTKFNFKLSHKDLSHELFYFLDFKKSANIKNKKKLPQITLQPCLYKKR